MSFIRKFQGNSENWIPLRRIPAFPVHLSTAHGFTWFHFFIVLLQIRSKSMNENSFRLIEKQKKYYAAGASCFDERPAN